MGEPAGKEDPRGEIEPCPPAETGVAAVAALLRQVGALFRGNATVSTRGCLMVNSIAELAARDAQVRAHATAYRDRLRADFGVALQVDAIFRAPTVAALAREVEEKLLAAVEAMSEEQALELA